MKNNQGFIVPILVAIIAVLVVGAGLYVYGNKKQEAPPNVDVVETNNSNMAENNTNATAKTNNDNKQDIAKSYCTNTEFAKNITKDLPSEVGPIVDRIITCNHWGEEVGSGDPERDKEIEKGAEADKCDTIDKDKSDLLSKYSLNQKVVDAINAADSWDERSCGVAPVLDSQNNTSNYIKANQNTSNNKSEIMGYQIYKSKVHILTRGLASLKIYGWPTGTEVTSSYNISSATLINVDEKGQQVWVWDPSKSAVEGVIMVTTIDFQGYDSEGHMVAKLSMKETGATSINEALFPPPLITKSDINTGLSEGNDWVTYDSNKFLSLTFKYPKNLGAPLKSTLPQTNNGQVGPVVTIGNSPGPVLTIFHGAFVRGGRQLFLDDHYHLVDIAKPLSYQSTINGKINDREVLVVWGASTGLAEYTAYIVGNGGNIVTVDFIYDYSLYPEGENVFNNILNSINIVDV